MESYVSNSNYGEYNQRLIKYLNKHFKETLVFIMSIVIILIILIVMFYTIYYSAYSNYYLLYLFLGGVFLVSLSAGVFTLSYTPKDTYTWKILNLDKHN